MFNRIVTLRGLVLLAGACLTSGAVLAAGPEVEGFGGGATFSGGGGTHGFFGGGGSWGFGDSLRVLGEVTYSPLASLSGSQSGVNVSATEHVLGVGGGAEFSFLEPSRRVRPYVLGVIGLDHLSASATVTGGGATGSGSASSNSVYGGVGGGVRYFIGKSWGIKPQIRYQHSTDVGNEIIYSVGVFFRFGN